MKKCESRLIYLETDEDLGIMKLTREKQHLAWVGKGKGGKSQSIQRLVYSLFH